MPDADERFVRVRRTAGFLIGEGAQSVLLAFGLIWMGVLVLNGFDGMATARFVSNTVGRLLAADPVRQAAFLHLFFFLFLFTFAGVVFVRAIDRMSKRRTA